MSSNLVEQKKLGKYAVRALIGEGSMARVYRAHDARLDRNVAIKTLKDHLLVDDDTAEEVIRRFGREARIAAKLQHENFVQVFEYVDEWDPPFIVMEFVEGKTLAQLLREDYAFRPGEVVHIVMQLLSALAYAHGKGVIHRDVKAQNVFFLPGPRIKVTDFGIAQIRSSTLTQVGSVMGTAAYMSPEQFRGEVVDHRADLWSVGIMLFELFSGKRPFRGGAETVRHKVLHEEPLFESSEPKQRIPDEFEPVIRKAIAKSPDERFQTAAEFSLALAEAAQEYSSSATQPPKRVAQPRVSTIRQAPKRQMVLGSRGAITVLCAMAATLMGALIYRTLPLKVDEQFVAERVHQVQCAVLDYRINDREVFIRGVAADQAQLEAMRVDLDKHSGGHSRLEVLFSGKRHCAVLDFVKELKAEGRLTYPAVNVSAGAGLISQGALLDVDVSGPDYHSYLGLDYFDAKGGVSHLLPDKELGSTQLSANERKSLKRIAGESINYEVTCPCGQEVIVGIASASPDVFAHREESESAQTYLAALRQSIDALPKGTLLSMHVTPVTSVGK